MLERGFGVKLRIQVLVSQKMLSDVIIGLPLQYADSVLIHGVPALPVLIALVLNAVPYRCRLDWNGVSVWAES